MKRPEKQPVAAVGASKRLDGLSLYSTGQMKRYYLLFAVNGGAFAIAKLLAESETQVIVGGLSLQALAVGCILFTGLMWRDIYAFGELLRTQIFGGKDIFQEGAKLILACLCVLLILGWLLAAFGPHE